MARSAWSIALPPTHLRHMAREHGGSGGQPVMDVGATRVESKGLEYDPGIAKVALKL
ncbi:hypothetical protein TRAPUB_2294 [Trametes pubescens]|uniref:Uncharacterized protein n=1 Tax=Trametes pubescens TaxID=154538 RepID=A0A1M2VGY2_TRAPU|nr:hypothetical protein TRAPUB_2294 [Trametes pubescens]